jgi:hypothetical protein
MWQRHVQEDIGFGAVFEDVGDPKVEASGFWRLQPVSAEAATSTTARSVGKKPVEAGLFFIDLAPIDEWVLTICLTTV